MNLKSLFGTIIFAGVSSLQAAGTCEALQVAEVGVNTPKPPGFNVVSADGFCEEGIYTLEASGHDHYWGWDRGGFAYLEIEGMEDFTFTAKIDGSKDDLFCNAEKVGIAARDGLEGNELAVQLRWDGYFSGEKEFAQISWFYRFQKGAETTELCSDDDPSGCFREGGTGVTNYDSWLRIIRESNIIKLAVSTNGTDWTEAGDEVPFVLTGSKIYVGLIGSCGNYGNSLAILQFSNISCEGPGCPDSASGLNFVRFNSGKSPSRGAGFSMEVTHGPKQSLINGRNLTSGK